MTGETVSKYRILERIGDTRNALASYERLLGLWKDADRDLVTLRDTKERLAALKSSATQ